jgi:hypothetical protein
MAVKNKLSVEDCNRYFYLSEEGYLHYKERPASDFKSRSAATRWAAHRAGAHACRLDKDGVVRTNMNYKQYEAAYIVYALHKGSLADELIYLDGDKTNINPHNLVEHKTKKPVISRVTIDNQTALEMDLNYLKECLILEDGCLIWRERPLSHFKTVNSQRTWNAKFSGKNACLVDSSEDRYRICIDGTFFKFHRVAWALHHDEWPTKILDHIDGDATNNKIENLREVTKSQNAENQKLRADNKHGVSGISFNKANKRWYVRITKEKNANYIGCFTTKEEAIEARHKAYKQLGFTERHGI